MNVDNLFGWLLLIVIIAALYIILLNEMRKWRIFLKTMNEKWYEMLSLQTAHTTEIIDQNNKERQRDYEMLKGMLESLEYHSHVLTRIEDKINAHNNQFTSQKSGDL